MRFRGVLKIGPLYDCIDGTRLLTKAAVNTLRHVNIVSSGSTGTVLALLGVDRNGLRGTSRLAQFAGDAALVARGVSAQCVLAAEAGRQVSFLVRVVDGHLRLKCHFTRQPEGAPDFCHEEDLR